MSDEVNRRESLLVRSARQSTGSGHESTEPGHESTGSGHESTGLGHEVARSGLGRRRAFRWLAIGLAVLPWVLFELGLRWLAGPVTAEAIDLDPVTGMYRMPPLFEFVPGDDGGRWEIASERMNFFRPASFAAVKPEGTRRVFVLGGSTVQGRPYATETAFSTWLQYRLESDDTAGSFEVVNCGGVSYASYRVAAILEEVLRHQPDAIVLYTGHNEFLEDRSYESVRAMGPIARQGDRVASKLHTVRWIKRQFATPVKLGTPSDETMVSGDDGVAGDGGGSRPLRFSAEVDAWLDHAAGMQAYRRDPPYRRRIEQQFEQTLRRMVADAKAAGVPILVCAPVSDIVDTPPFKVEPDPQLPERPRFELEAAWTIARNREIESRSRIEASRRCLQIDPEHAGAHYVLGSLLYKRLMNGQPASGEAIAHHLTAARDFDVCPLRATSPIIESVKRVAQEQQIPWVDTLELFDTRSVSGIPLPDGLSDPEWFVDHVHPGIHGHQRIAAALADRFEKWGWIGQSTATERRYEARAAEQIRSLGEEYFQRGQQRLEGLRQWATGRSAKVGIGG